MTVHNLKHLICCPNVKLHMLVQAGAKVADEIATDLSDDSCRLNQVWAAMSKVFGASMGQILAGVPTYAA
jgi:hypothetical protein